MNDPMLTATTLRALPCAETWRQETARLADEQRLWSGAHGGVLTGREIADLLVAARRHLEAEGWRPTEFNGVVEALIDESGGDLAAWTAAKALVELMLQARSGAPRPVNLDAWGRRAGRSWTEVCWLLRDAAQLAREHGPLGGGR
ncbi:hypothetical protein [Streptomyces sp. MP131-18]|uniref:hypothetical protein n=1 Tax=Streptomyces sp. MP131-18 TaxID=1857892 RepID=UPI0009D55A9C|nr:hypothetical protein [Streptomyces sp. MP131-18]ONK09466.1 hypothetical protein STBA_01660 [Streptomyces sp. MP131-18]